MAEKQQKRKEYKKTYSERNYKRIFELGYDFRHVLRVIRKRSRCAIIASAIKVFCFVLFQTLKLNCNMQTITDPDFSKWLLDIDDGMILLPLTTKTQFSVEAPIF